ncbi:Hsp20/alpha crystallin family protein [Algoriphagus yeomjeoni]|uniref:HSP20 family protein n=1 Tax=Algoriphagus yeomjeoni TaxID=291403 RepID=A0A327PP13_9BACT|nr:Hsp20/alpha crystallin family protein [Algoriphagus yeomjeoni]RAI91416.1 HSP20 family protein [Algoriphagus yeomjeoni]
MNTLMKRNGYSPVTSLFDDFPTGGFFNWLDSAGIGRSNSQNTLPSVNILETDSDFKVEMAVPGMKKEDFRVELDNNTLTIQAEASTTSENHDESASYARKEFSYQSFRRSFYLPNTVENDKIEATYQDGVLRLIIPKREEAKKKPVKTIQIS